MQDQTDRDVTPLTPSPGEPSPPGGTFHRAAIKKSPSPCLHNRDPNFQKGTPCKYGHLSGRYPSGWCRECARVAGRERDLRPERKAKKAAKRRLRRKTDFDFREREKAATAKRHRQRAQRDPEFRNKRTASIKAWVAANPELARSSDRLSKVLRRNREAVGRFQQPDIDAIFRMQNGRCAYCRAPLQDYEIDHIIPLCRGGSNWPRNLQLTCVSGCNQAKGASDPIEFARTLGLLL